MNNSNKSNIFYTLARNGNGNQYYVPLQGQLSAYHSAGNFSADEINHCINFAFKLVRDKVPHKYRPMSFLNYLRGALAEHAVCNQLNEFNQLNSNFPNLSIFKTGDKGYDVIVNDQYRVQVKSLSPSGQLLILTDEYYQNSKTKFDCIVVQRINLYLPSEYNKDNKHHEQDLLNYVSEQFDKYGCDFDNLHNPLINGYFGHRLLDVDYELGLFMTQKELQRNAKKLTFEKNVNIKREVFIKKNNKASSKLSTVVSSLSKKSIIIEIKNMHPLNKILDELELR